MCNWVCLSLIFAAQELVANMLFYFIRKVFDKRKGKNTVMLSIVKGMLERLILLVALAINLHQVLTVFAALKLGTRLKEDQENRISNDYFLVGNLVSLLLVMFSWQIFHLIR